MYRHNMTVMLSEVSCSNEIKVRALLNRLQDVAGLAVENLEGSASDLMRRGYAWILLKYGLEVAGRLPGLDEAVVIETRHSMNDGFHTLRIFRVCSAADEAETLITAKTSWVLFDLASERPVRAARRLPEVFTEEDVTMPIDPNFLSIPRFSGAALKDVPILSEMAFPVRFHDLDANGHVNNAVYFEWAYEATPLDLLSWSVREMRAEFRVGARLGETVLTRVKEISGGDFPNEKPKGTRAFGYDMASATGRSLARFYSVWAPL